MTQFLKTIFLFLSLFLLIIVAGIFIPITPRASTAHLLSQLDKDALLKNTPSPRLILIGGSNLSMSVNSQLLFDSLQLHPVNMGLSASIGLLYMLDHALPHIQPGDVVIVCPEYSQFYESLSIGTEDLLRIVLDKSPKELFNLRWSQLSHSLKYIPKYALSKFKPSEYFFDAQANSKQVYLRSSFNQYGDMDKHWLLPGGEFNALDPMLPVSYDRNVVGYLQEFELALEQREAALFITFPALHEKSFDSETEEIAWVEQQLHAGGFSVLGNPSRYRMPDSLMFDTPYHLIKVGVDYRTQLLIEDIKKFKSKSTLFCQVE